MKQTEVKAGAIQKARILWNKELTWVKNITIWFIHDLLYTAVLTFPTCYNQMTLGSHLESAACVSSNLNF